MMQSIHRPRLAVLLIAGLAAAGACTDTSGTTQPVSDHSARTTGLSRAALGALGQVRSRLTIRDQLKALSDRAPGFTGVFLDGAGVLTIAVARDDFPLVSTEAVLAWARSYTAAAANATASSVRFRRVPYSYSELYDRFKLAEQVITPGDGLTLAAIDESRGVIVLGLQSLDRASTVRERLAQAGVPGGMVEFRQQDVGRGELKLSDAVRPTAGGIKTQHHNAGYCTLGFNVGRWDEGWNAPPYYFFSAAHCQGSTWGQYQAYPVYQVNSGVGEEFEVVPIKTYPAWPCPSASKSPCELADLVVYKYDDTVAVRYGNVAKPDGSLNIIGYYNVQPQLVGTIAGQVVTKVGAFGGQSTGTVSLTCTDQPVATTDHPSTVWVLCLGEANYNSADGDSGGPIFIPYNPANPNQTPDLVGIHSNAAGSHRYFTTMDYIDYATNYAYYYW